MSARQRFRYYMGGRYVAAWKPAPESFCRCLDCGRAWDDSKPTALTPVPAARCPFEYWHTEKDRQRTRVPMLRP